MKADIAYYLLLLYLTVILKPLIPLVSDLLSHGFNEIEHMATVHAKYGSHHLEKELQDNSTKNNQDKNATALTSKEEPCFTVLAEINNYYYSATFDKQYNLTAYFKLPFGFSNRVIPPPKFNWI